MSMPKERSRKKQEGNEIGLPKLVEFAVPRKPSSLIFFMDISTTKDNRLDLEFINFIVSIMSRTLKNHKITTEVCL